MTPPPLDGSALLLRPQAGSGAAALTAPNVFTSYECSRADIGVSSLASNIQETYAQCSEDLIVEGLLAARLALQGRAMSTLFYVEIGANHPVQTSNTYLLYRKHGASGVLVDANARLTDDLRRVRPRDLVLHTAVSAKTDPTLTFSVCEVSEVSSLAVKHIESFCTGAETVSMSVPNLHVNDLLSLYTDRQVDFLSIDVEGVDLEILEALNLSRFRPLVIQCEPREHFIPGTAQQMVKLLHQRGYTLVARTSINLIFVDSASLDVTEPSPQICSFDIFDTLISRRCVDPQRVFDLVETASGIIGFAAARRASEVAVAGQGTTLDMIYAELATRLGLETTTLDTLKQVEIDAELAQVIPVAENLTKVKPGDLLLSDMYLPADVISNLLNRAGLDVPVGLVVTADGKQSGRIWPHVKTSFRVTRHLGDNRLSDVESPTRFGIVSEHTRVTEPTPVEQWCLDSGLRALGEIMRAARLRISAPNPVLRKLLLVQTQFNFPLLFLGSIALHRYALSKNAQRLLFASRDCHLWHGLFKTLYPEQMQTEYFYTSRRARIQGSQGYRDYAAERLCKGALLIDLCGSGWSSARLLQSLGLEGRGLYFLHRIPAVPLYERQHPTPDNCEMGATIGATRQGLDHVRLEMSNYALHGSVIDIRQIAGTPVPVFDIDERLEAERNMVAAQVTCFRSMASEIPGRISTDTIRFQDADLIEIAARLYSLLSQDQSLTAAYAVSHHREDLRTLSALKLLPE